MCVICIYICVCVVFFCVSLCACTISMKGWPVPFKKMNRKPSKHPHGPRLLPWAAGSPTFDQSTSCLPAMWQYPDTWTRWSV